MRDSSRLVTHTQIAVSTLLSLVAAAIVVAAYARWPGMRVTFLDALLISLTVGVSIVLWREAANTPILNQDPIPLVSPNDVLCPVLTYVCLGLLAGFRPSVRTERWPQLRAVLTLVSLAVNIVTI